MAELFGALWACSFGFRMDQAWPDPDRKRCLWLCINRLEPEGGESPQLGTDGTSLSFATRGRRFRSIDLTQAPYGGREPRQGRADAPSGRPAPTPRPRGQSPGRQIPSPVPIGEILKSNRLGRYLSTLILSRSLSQMYCIIKIWPLVMKLGNWLMVVRVPVNFNIKSFVC